MTFKEGDIVKIKRDCSKCLAGEIGVLKYGSYKNNGSTDELFAITENVKHLNEGGGCSCKENWELIQPVVPTTNIGGIKINIEMEF